MRNIPAIILGLLLGWRANVSDKLSTPDFSGSPQGRFFLSCIGLHSNVTLVGRIHEVEFGRKRAALQNSTRDDIAYHNHF